jgi:hypothetical protein
LKNLHLQFTAASPPPVTANLSDLISLNSNLTTSSTYSNNVYYTSEGVILSVKASWIAPVGSFKELYYIITYVTITG